MFLLSLWRKLPLKVVSFPFTESACSTGWVQRRKSCYIVIDIPTAEWSAAQWNCLKLGGDLVKITCNDENQFVYNLTNNQVYTTGVGAWLGLHRKADNKFYWTDGTLLAGYNKWATGEPNNPSTEKCAHLYGKSNSRRGMWNDVQCKFTGNDIATAPVILCKKALKWLCFSFFFYPFCWTSSRRFSTLMCMLKQLCVKITDKIKVERVSQSGLWFSTRG